jgi:hypothetical protein
MKDHKDQTQKKPWRKPEIKEIKIQETEGGIGPGGDASWFEPMS